MAEGSPPAPFGAGNAPGSLPEPYQGLRPYGEKDRDRFFGWEAECKILIDKILANRLTLLFAASGVGKSSLLQAAVLPRLKDPKQENLDAIYYNDWVSPPLEGLRQAVEGYLQRQNYIDAFPPLPSGDLNAVELSQRTLSVGRQPFAATGPAPAAGRHGDADLPVNSTALSGDLREFLGFAALFTRQPLILILDQFEEFFRYRRYQPDFKPFIQQLARAVTDREVPLAVVISMREDFALELNAFKPHLPTPCCSKTSTGWRG